LIFGSFRSENWEPSDDAIREFSSLARRAGGHLPLAVREQFSVRQNDPAGWWLAYMWLHSPPVENKLQQRKSWPEPFLAAAEAIERGGLCTPRRPTDMGGSSADARVGGEPAIRAARQEPGLDGCVPADTLALEDGIARNRLSEAARDGKVRSMPAPRGMKDSQGKAVHRLYHRGDALEYCSPKRVTKRTRRRLGFRN
jgi:hypothetical protein